MRTLHLTNPLMHGADVKAAQTLLAKHSFLATTDVDGYFGSHSAQACERAKFRLGYAVADIKPTYGDQLNGYLKGTVKLPADYQKRADARKSTTYAEFEILAIRHKIVTIAQWGVRNEPDIHYEQRRPIDGIDDPYKLPLHTDCSGFVTLCYQWANAPDPNGKGFIGLGYTGTLLQHMKHIMKSMIMIGDLVVYGNFPGHHVAVIVAGPASDPLLVSHGEEKGPEYIRNSEEQKYQPTPANWLTLTNWGITV